MSVEELGQELGLCFTVRGAKTQEGGGKEEKHHLSYREPKACGIFSVCHQIDIQQCCNVSDKR